MEAVSFESLEARLKFHSTRFYSANELMPVSTLTLTKSGSADRQRIEDFIHQRFAKQYDAEITHFLPYILFSSQQRSIEAAVGFQPAKAATPLFLEQYLDADIELILSLLTHSDIKRNQIVEIGNLASSRQRATQALFLLLALLLSDAGFGWVVFTANSRVKNWLDRLHIRFITIQRADPARLHDKHVQWGRYYEDHPVVLAADVQQTQILLEQPLTQALLSSYQHELASFKAAVLS